MDAKKAHTEPETAHKEAATAHIEDQPPPTVHEKSWIDTITAYIDYEKSHIKVAISHKVPAIDYAEALTPHIAPENLK